MIQAIAKRRSFSELAAEQLLSKRTAHINGDPEVVSHCFRCGSGALTGSPDGMVRCSVCESSFMVFVQPQHVGQPVEQQPGVDNPVDPASKTQDVEAPGAPPIPEPVSGPAIMEPDGTVPPAFVPGQGSPVATAALAYAVGVVLSDA